MRRQSLANLRLVFAGLPRLRHPSDAYRLQLAEYLLDEGMAPATLMKELGLDQSLSAFSKYNQDQPRVPAGHGVQSGRWGTVEGTLVIDDASSSPSPTANGAPSPSTAAAGVIPTVALGTAAGLETAEGAGALGTLASGLFAATAAAGEFLAGLATLAGGIGTGVVLGAVVVPSPNKLSTEGPLPGDPDLQYSLNGDEGILRLTHESAAGTELVALAYRGRDGIFFESETGLPIARDVGGSVVFDAASLADVTPPPKGPGYAKLLRYSYFNKQVLPARWANQAGRQVSATVSAIMK